MSDRPRPDRQEGVFETLLIIDGRPIERDAHLARLHTSLAELFPDHDPPQLDVGAERGDSLGSLRITVAPGRGEELEARTVQREARDAFPLLRDREAPLVSTSLYSFPLPGGLGAHKWADRSLLDGGQDKPPNALPVILDEDGVVLEASRANVFVVRAGELLTPPTDGRILPGITRARVMEIATSRGVEAREVELSPGDLLAADEVFLTGSVRGIERVGAFDGIELPTRSEVGLRIATELCQNWLGAQVG